MTRLRGITRARNNPVKPIEERPASLRPSKWDLRDCLHHAALAFRRIEEGSDRIAPGYGSHVEHGLDAIECALQAYDERLDEDDDGYICAECGEEY